MAIKFPDSITQNNANYITVSAIDGDVQGIYFVDTIAERDAIGDADVSLDNHRALGTVVFVGTSGYVYDGANLSDVTWQDAASWTPIGSSGELGELANVDTTTVGTGDSIVYDGTEFVSDNRGLSATVTSDTPFNVDTFAIADYSSAIYAYSIKGSSSRAGQIMVDYDGLTTIELTDISTNPIGTDSSEPEFQAVISGGTHLALQMVNGNGYSFKAQATRI